MSTEIILVIIAVVIFLGYAVIRGIIDKYVGANKIDFENRKILKEYAALKKAQTEALKTETEKEKI